MSSISKPVYVVEHLEEGLETWCCLEYAHMCEVIDNRRLIFANFPEEGFGKVSTDHHPTIFRESVDQLRDTQIDWEKTCLLDMDSNIPLSTDDKFQFLVFGGILGNVPSDDRTAEIRHFEFFHRRNLGPIQMTTNTALLVCRIVLEDGVGLDSIPYVDEPEIITGTNETTILPFRYVASSYYTKLSEDRGVPVLPRGMIEYLKESEDAF